MNFDISLELEDYSEAIEADIRKEYDYKSRHFDAWTYVEKKPVELEGFELVASLSSPESSTYVLHNVSDGILADIHFYLPAKNINLALFGKPNINFETYVEKFKEILIPQTDDAVDEVEISFWYSSQSGATQVDRNIRVPEWEEVEENYNHATVRSLNSLMEGFVPAHGGQLVLWRGEPGTGKTYALRALCRQWKEWCSFNYIVDPDVFFRGDNTSYLMRIILSEDEDDIEAGKDWKLLILEDAGELLRVDARDRVGQALSRLLNLVDGMIGQGLKILVLITTNEEIEALHPAVARPGRTASVINFEKLTEQEAKEWAKKKDFIIPATNKHMTLAELFGIWSEYDNKKVEDLKKEAIGFRMIAGG